MRTLAHAIERIRATQGRTPLIDDAERLARSFVAALSTPSPAKREE